jgi:predicted Zn-dependent protease
VATLESLQAKEPDSPDYTLLLAGAYERAGQADKAAAMRRRADQQSVGQPVVNRLSALGSRLSARQKRKNAFPLLPRREPRAESRALPDGVFL